MRLRHGGRRHHLLSGDRGASSLELSIVAPGLVVLIFMGVQTGLWLFGRNVAEQSAREAVSRLRVEVVTTTQDSALAAASRRAENYVRGVGGSLVRDPQATSVMLTPTRARVEVTGTAVTLVPGLELNVRGAAEGDIEQFQVDS